MAILHDNSRLVVASAGVVVCATDATVLALVELACDCASNSWLRIRTPRASGAQEQAKCGQEWGW